MRSEYIAGKLAVLFTFLMLVTFVPAILLLLLQVMFEGSFKFLKTNLFLLPAITVGVAAAGACVVDVHDAGAVVAVEERALRRRSSTPASPSSRRRSTACSTPSPGEHAMAWLSIGDNVAQVVDVIFRLKPRYDTPWQVSLLVILGLVVLSISVLERRVRGVEVVT